MATITLLLFTGVVCIGLYLVILGVKHHRRSPALGLLHAALAITGIIFLFMQIIEGPTVKLNNFAALFLLLAVIGGGMVFALREADKPPSMTMVTAHAIMGIIGIAMLAGHVFS